MLSELQKINQRAEQIISIYQNFYLGSSNVSKLPDRLSPDFLDKMGILDILNSHFVGLNYLNGTDEAMVYVDAININDEDKASEVAFINDEDEDSEDIDSKDSKEGGYYEFSVKQLIQDEDLQKKISVVLPKRFLSEGLGFSDELIQRFYNDLFGIVLQTENEVINEIEEIESKFKEDDFLAYPFLRAWAEFFEICRKKAAFWLFFKYPQEVPLETCIKLWITSAKTILSYSEKIQEIEQKEQEQREQVENSMEFFMWIYLNSEELETSKTQFIQEE